MKEELNLGGDKSQPEINQKELDKFKEIMNEIVGTRAVHILDKDLNTLGKLPISQSIEALTETSGIYAILIDGKIDKELLSLAKDKGTSYLVCMSKQGVLNGKNVNIITKEELNEL